jgi:hypothetical protein
MWPVLASALARAVAAAVEELLAAAELAGLDAAGALAVAAGEELELVVLAECPRSAKNHTPANRHTTTSAI